MAVAAQTISFHPSPCSSSRCHGGVLFPSPAGRPSSVQFTGRIVSSRTPLAILGRPVPSLRVVRGKFVPKAAPSSPPSKSQEQKWVHEGLITESLPNGMFRVRLDNEQDLILGYVSGKIRKSFIRILPGDRVRVEMSRYDSTKGRIIYRLRKNES